MKLIFFDEAKHNLEKRDYYPYYHIGGVGIDEGSLAEVEAQINGVVKKRSPARTRG